MGANYGVEVICLTRSWHLSLWEPKCVTSGVTRFVQRPRMGCVCVYANMPGYIYEGI